MSKMKQRKRIEEYDSPYVPSDSEEEYSDTEKILLEKARRGTRNADIEESEEEVYAFPSEESSDENEGKMSDSDIEGKGEEDDLPDVRAWGQKRRNFYSTDYVDQDYGGYDEKDVEAAEREEEEARAIQKRLTEQLDEGDFSLDLFSKKTVQKEKEIEDEVIKTDISKLSKRQKLALLEKESPEFFSLIEEFKSNMTELQKKIEPIVKLIKEKKIPASSADSYITTKYHLLLNYSTNIAFYLLLKAKHIPVHSHPVVRRLYQYRQLLQQLEPVDKAMAPQLQSILEVISEGKDIVAVADNDVTDEKQTKKTKQKILRFLVDKKKSSKIDSEIEEPTEMVDTTARIEESIVADKESSGHSEMEEEKMEAEAEEEEKRGITYQIAKNKGLTPYRKKEMRNPRVRHRNKYRKAQIRRKGQIREPRKEIEKYGGEISGIKIGVVKGIKIK
ncbi:something about silencing protein 10 [Periplaneta americana]|uniref:something about silencing protein 10 n=1 Tax=Periplaneta americana TaxID=6978 RepID=UPI0037E74246